MPRPQVPRQENKVNNNIKVEMEKRLLSHQLDVSGGSKRPTRKSVPNEPNIEHPVEMTQKKPEGETPERTPKDCNETIPKCPSKPKINQITRG
tara:strand:- start:105 stop:383 length:279 start_codon:yes stop_codon:yes gene_type:complete